MSRRIFIRDLNSLVVGFAIGERKRTVHALVHAVGGVPVPLRSVAANRGHYAALKVLVDGRCRSVVSNVHPYRSSLDQGGTP